MEQIRIGFETALKSKLAQKTGTFQNEEAVLLKSFKHFDIDEDGLVNYEDWVKAIEKIGIVIRSEVDLRHLFNFYDMHKTGKISYKDFADVLFRQKPLKVPPKLVVEEDKTAKEATIDPFEKLKTKLKSRGVRGLIGLAKIIKDSVEPKKTMLTLGEFKKCLSEARLGLSDQEIADIFSKFEFKKTNKIKHQVFLNRLKGTMNEQRKEMATKVYNYYLDPEKTNAVPLYNLKAKYNPKHHPDVIQGRRTEDDILLDFLETFDTFHEFISESVEKDTVPLSEFIDYYSYVSPLFEDDKDFNTYIENSWKPELAPVEEKKIEEPKPAMKKIKYLGEQRPSYKKATANKSSELNMLYVNAKEEKEKKEAEKVSYSKRLGEEAVEWIKKNLAKRGPKAVLALLGIVKRMKEFDPEKAGFIQIADFTKALLEYRIVLAENNANAIYSLYDERKDGSINYQKVVNALVGELSPYRKQLVDKLFAKLDKEKTGLISKAELIEYYNPAAHPSVQLGKKTKDDAALDFATAFEIHNKSIFRSKESSCIERVQFEDFFGYISATIEDDSEFEQIVEESWNVPIEPPAAIIEKPTIQLNPPFDVSAEPTNYTTTKQLMSMKVLEKPQEEIDERKVFNKLKRSLKLGGVRKVFAFQQSINALDVTHEKILTCENLVAAITMNQLPINQKEAEVLFAAFDTYGEGVVDQDEFLFAVIGTMYEQRRTLIVTLYDLLDISQLTVEELKARYTPARAPEVIRKKRTAEDLRREFEETWDLYYNELSENNDGKVGLKQFEGYYDSVSMCFEEDKAFETFIASVWSIDKLVYEKQKRVQRKKKD